MLQVRKSLYLDPQARKTQLVIDQWLLTATLFWNLLIEHTRNNVMAYLAAPATEESATAFINKLTAIAEATLDASGRQDCVIGQRWRKHLLEIRKLPASIFLKRLIDMGRSISEVKEGIDGSTSETEKKDWLLKLPRFKGKGSTKSIRITDAHYQKVDGGICITLSEGKSVVLTLAKDQMVELDILDEEDTHYELTLTYKPSREDRAPGSYVMNFSIDVP